MIQLLLMDTSPDIQQQLISFIRAFGLNQTERTPCGQPVSVSEAHALMELAKDAPFSQQVLGERSKSGKKYCKSFSKTTRAKQLDKT